MEVKVSGFFCSRCKHEWLQPQTDIPVRGGENFMSHQTGRCDEQLQKQEETYEAIEIAGYVCSVCYQVWCLKNSNEDPSHEIADEVKNNLHTRCDREIKRRVTTDIIAYFCDGCQREWQLLKWDTNPTSTIGDVSVQCCYENRRFLDEIRTYEGSVEVIGTFCSGCDNIWPLPPWNIDYAPSVKNAIRSYNARSGCLGSVQKYEESARVIMYSCRSCKEELLFKEWNGNPVPNTKNVLQDQHHRTGCRGIICTYEHNLKIIGYFCDTCKKEWLSQIWNGNPPHDINFQIVDPHIVSMFCCLQVSDTGDYVPWKNIGHAEGIKRGDHVAWPRCIGYWHHAIVEDINNDGTLNVIEWDTNKIQRNKKRKWGWLETCCCSPLYKVTYPEEVIQQNPPELVLSRARARLNSEGYNLFSDNCEHFATFCKTGCHQSGQIFQLKANLHGWCRRFFVSFVHIALIVSFSESLESWLGKAKEWLGAILLIVIEIFYFIVVILVIYHVDTTRTRFIRNQAPECSKTCRYASLKGAFQSISLISFSIVFSVFVKEFIVEKFSIDLPDVILEILLGILGGGIGNMVGFWCYCFRCCCSLCINDNPEHGDGRYQRL